MNVIVWEVASRERQCAATTTVAGRVASSKDVPEAFAVASSEWFP